MKISKLIIHFLILSLLFADAYAQNNDTSFSEKSQITAKTIDKRSKMMHPLKIKPYYLHLITDDVVEAKLKNARCFSILKNHKIQMDDYHSFAEKVVTYYENNGFPFTTVSLDNLQLTCDSATAILKIDINQCITFDSVIVKGNLKLSKSYLYPYLGWKRKKLYDESLVQQINKKITELPFATQIREPGVEFVGDKAYLYLFLDKRKNNRFDGIIGLVPVDEKSGRVSLNGELSMNLNNLFSIGEIIDLQWKSPKRYSQYLWLHANFPYLFKTPLGIDAEFLLDKQDTSYLTMDYAIAFQYSFLANSYVRAIYNYSTSNVLSSNLIAVDDSMNYIDYKKSMYGIEFTYRKLDYLFNPRKGVAIKLYAAAGKRKIMTNSSVDPSIYDDVEMNAVRYKLSGEVTGYIPMHKRWVMVMGVKGGSLLGNNNYYNELYKIGGMQTLQGFDENSIFASSYAIALAEIRFLFSKLSYINIFFNGAWYEQKVVKNYFNDTPLGFGIGIALDTKVGMFYLSYALGKQKSNPISLKTGKIHFGIKIGF